MRLRSNSFLANALLIALVVVGGSTSATAATYTIDGAHSSALFKVKHFEVSNFYAMFNDISGTVVYDSASPEASSIEVTIAADSLDSRNERRTGHIKSPDFLDAAQFPTITFKSTSVKATGDQLEVTGDLTLHGVTQEITVTAEKTGQGPHPRSGAELIGFEARFTVDRTQHDMNFMVGPLSADVEFVLAIEAGKE